jgi:formylmethanofuran dehydrogenase subunit B
MTAGQQTEHVTCLGCGCTCDDVTVRVVDGRIVEVSPVCPIGRAWFGDGQVPSRVLQDGVPVGLGQAVESAAGILAGSQGRCLIYLGTDLSTQSQRAAVAIADLLHATVDSETSATAAAGLTTAQRRGRAGATLGEIRNRGDVFLFWGVDPSERYPRFLARYSLDPVGIQVPEGRSGRYVISASIGADRGLTGADSVLELSPDEEIAALTLMRATVLGNPVTAASPLAAQAADVAKRLAAARYAVVVHDAEPTAEPRNPLRVEALVALAQALNGPTRAALCSLRAGGNRLGAESVLTWQTGYPFAVDYSLGYPRYRPDRRGIAGLATGRYEAALLLGTTQGSDAGQVFAGLNTITIGPRASETPFRAAVAIDTGVAGIHEEGTAYRMDDVPLPLRPCLPGPARTVDVLRDLAQAIRTYRGASTR